MARHGYLHDSYDNSDFGGGDGRERGWSDERDRQSPRDWRESQDRAGGWMLEGRERQRGGDWPGREQSGGGEDEGFFSRMADRATSWFDEDEDEGHRSRGGRSGERQRSSGSQSGYGREHGFGGFQGDYSGRGQQQGGFGGQGDWQSRQRRATAHPDDHYRSWRDKQMQALDRDYEDYCREREQQFHSEFDSWRQKRQGSQTGQSSSQMDQGASAPSAGQGGDIGGASGSDELLLDRNTGGMTTDAPQEPMSSTDTDSAATLGTTPGTSARGRR